MPADQLPFSNYQVARKILLAVLSQCIEPSEIPALIKAMIRIAKQYQNYQKDEIGYFYYRDILENLVSRIPDNQFRKLFEVLIYINYFDREYILSKLAHRYPEIANGTILALKDILIDRAKKKDIVGSFDSDKYFVFCQKTNNYLSIYQSASNYELGGILLIWAENFPIEYLPNLIELSNLIKDKDMQTEILAKIIRRSNHEQLSQHKKEISIAIKKIWNFKKRYFISNLLRERIYPSIPRYSANVNTPKLSRDILYYIKGTVYNILFSLVRIYLLYKGRKFDTVTLETINSISETDRGETFLVLSTLALKLPINKLKSLLDISKHAIDISVLNEYFTFLVLLSFRLPIAAGDALALFAMINLTKHYIQDDIEDFDVEDFSIDELVFLDSKRIERWILQVLEHNLSKASASESFYNFQRYLSITVYSNNKSNFVSTLSIWNSLINRLGVGNTTKEVSNSIKDITTWWP